MSKHTPGPWRTQGTCVTSDSGLIAIAPLPKSNGRGRKMQQFSPEQQLVRLANARLIAASPEMYEVLKATLKEHDRVFKQCDAGCKCLACRVRAIIAKAEGKTAAVTPASIHEAPHA